MKQLLLCFLLGIFGFTTFSQISWFPLGAEWFYNNEEGNGNQGLIHYQVIKDTVVAGKESKILRRKYIFSSGKLYNTIDYIVYEENSKVFYYLDSTFSIIYDFSLNEGDTLKFLDDCALSPPVIIDSIRPIQIDDETLRMQYVSYTAIDDFCNGLKITSVFFEKMGNFTDFINYPYCGCGDVFYEPYLRCYEDSSIYFRNSWYDRFYKDAPCDSLIIYTGITNNEKNKIEVFPNPTNEFVNFNWLNIERVEVFDIYGKKVQDYMGQDITVINLKQLATGYYILNITLENSETYNLKIKKN